MYAFGLLGWDSVWNAHSGIVASHGCLVCLAFLLVQVSRCDGFGQYGVVIWWFAKKDPR